jgi:long-chain acyl-CoA synthetase
MIQDPPNAIEIPEAPLFRLLEETAARHPRHMAVTMDGADITYAGLLQASRAFASGLRAQGVEKGDRVGLILPNIPQYVTAYFGILQAGGVVVNLSLMLPGRTLEDLLAHSGARIAVTADVVASPLLQSVKGDGLKKIIVVSLGGKGLPEGGHSGGPECIPFESLVQGRWRGPLPADISGRDPAVFQYTSGITGRPKAAVLTHRNLLANVLQISRAVALEEPENGGAVCVIPFFHVFGMTVCLLSSVHKGHRMILVPRFDWSSVLSLLETVKTCRPVSLPAVSSLWAALVSHPEAGSCGLESILVPSGGGSPLPAWVQERFRTLTGRNIMEAYGLSEASSTTHINPPDRVVPGSIGRPLPGTEARIVDIETGEIPCGEGEIGELIVRGPQVMKEYWLEPELTAGAVRNGWLYTGDLARTDPDGYFYVVDRKDDLIISSGFNIYPTEIEDLLTSHSSIKAAAVVGARDRIRGQVVKAFVVPESEISLTSEDVLEFCRANLAEFKVPKTVVLTREIPHAPTGKPIRRALREAGTR